MIGQQGVNLGLGCGYLEAVHHSGIRILKALPPKYVVIHSTESPNKVGSAHNVAVYFSKEIDEDLPPSAHITLDDRRCWRSLHDNVIPWAAPPFNMRGLHIELCGYAKWGRAEWFTHRATIDKAAQATAKWCHAYGIPIRWLTPAACRAYRSGITSHRNVSIAFKKSDHTDPGPEDNKHFPYDYFMAQVRKETDGLH